MSRISDEYLKWLIKTHANPSDGRDVDFFRRQTMADIATDLLDARAELKSIAAALRTLDERHAVECSRHLPWNDGGDPLDCTCGLAKRQRAAQAVIDAAKGVTR